MYLGSLPPVTNQQTWQFMLEVLDKETDEDIDLTGASIVFELRHPKHRTCELLATTDNGKIVIIEIGFFQVTFDRTDMQTLKPVTYDVGCIITQNGITNQFIVGTVPVLDGIVTQ